MLRRYSISQPQQVSQLLDVAVHDHPDLIPEMQMLYDRAGVAFPAAAVNRQGGRSVASV